MPIRIGNNLFSKIYKGSTEVDKAYLGSSLLYQSVDIRGEQSYTTPGTYSWTAPEGVTSVSVVTVGGGASGSVVLTTNTTTGRAGGGGGLGWKNNISVVPGQSYTVVVGAGGTAVTRSTTGVTSGNSGQDSYFINTSTVRGGSGTSSSGGGWSGDGGTFGGAGGTSRFSVFSDGYYYIAGGGGGAGGYIAAPSGSLLPSHGGGDGTFSGIGYSGAGSGGSAGIQQNSSGSSFATIRGGTGGGTNILGIVTQQNLVADGSTGNDGNSSGNFGKGGFSIGNRTATSLSSGAGSSGAVRIVWGNGRAFPSTDVGTT
jgi:hypothetical protein